MDGKQERKRANGKNEKNEVSNIRRNFFFSAYLAERTRHTEGRKQWILIQDDDEWTEGGKQMRSERNVSASKSCGEEKKRVSFPVECAGLTAKLSLSRPRYRLSSGVGLFVLRKLNVAAF
mmetsp:Transcript_40562/g.79940  ORF Transcript_40562/g.79940 Transcript_40562/m.79940 type:complete len:120 (-) Transcript_40562:550-909(-)